MGRRRRSVETTTQRRETTQRRGKQRRGRGKWHSAESRAIWLCSLFFSSFFITTFHVPKHNPKGGLVPPSEIYKYLAQINV
jgi:hypothetical protein